MCEKRLWFDIGSSNVTLNSPQLCKAVGFDVNIDEPIVMFSVDTNSSLGKQACIALFVFYFAGLSS